MCQTIITPDNLELDTAQELTGWLTVYLGRAPRMIIHPAYQKQYRYDPDHCLCPFEIGKTFTANGLTYRETHTGDFQLIS